MKHSRERHFLFTLLLLINGASLFGQQFEPKKRLVEPETTVTSKIMGKDYQLYISFPKNYSTKDTTKYPVLYVLDGWKDFAQYKILREYLDYDKELENFIMIGVSSGLDFITYGTNRTNEYTTSKDTIWDMQFEKEAAKQYNLDYNLSKGKIHSGGAPKFLECLITEIIPYVDKHYKTNTDRGITGHSFGGLFTAYCLINSKAVFNRFGINSPSLWWNKEEILNQADVLFNKNEKTWDIPSTKVFISMGQLEGPQMIPAMVKFSTLLEARNYKNVALTWKLFEGKTHSSVLNSSFKETLLVLYGKKK